MQKEEKQIRSTIVLWFGLTIILLFLFSYFVFPGWRVLYYGSKNLIKYSFVEPQNYQECLEATQGQFKPPPACTFKNEVFEMPRGG